MQKWLLFLFIMSNFLHSDKIIKPNNLTLTYYNTATQYYMK